MQLVEEARLYHLLPDRRSGLNTTKRCTPRKNAGQTQVSFKFAVTTADSIIKASQMINYILIPHIMFL